MSNTFHVNTNEYLTQCDPKDVISFNSEKWTSISKLKDIIYRAFSQQGITSTINHVSGHSDLKNSGKWFFQGEECEILKAGSKGWQKGKLKISVVLEFVPDNHKETESPLDDVRQEINQ